MCQAKIQDHYSNKYKCLRPNSKSYLVEIIYGSGHKEGRKINYSRTLCSKHGKTFRHGLRQNAQKGHSVKWLELEHVEDKYAYDTRLDFYNHGNHNHNVQTNERLKVISSIKMEIVGVAQFGFPGIMSGLYIEHVWSFTDEEFKDYINWALSLQNKAK